MTAWPRDAYVEAVWESETLRPNERLVAYAFARYAGSTDVAWCSWDELRRRTGIRSRDAINRALGGLLNAGWLVEVEHSRQHYSARYRLAIPPQGSVKRTAEPVPGVRETDVWDSSDVAHQMSRRPFPDTRGPFPDTRGPFNGPDLSNRELKPRASDLGEPLAAALPQTPSGSVPTASRPPPRPLNSTPDAAGAPRGSTRGPAAPKTHVPWAFPQSAAQTVTPNGKDATTSTCRICVAKGVDGCYIHYLSRWSE